MLFPKLGIELHRRISRRDESRRYEYGREMLLLNLGVEPYDRALDLQHRLVAARREGQIEDVLILSEHPPVWPQDIVCDRLYRLDSDG